MMPVTLSSVHGISYNFMLIVLSGSNSDCVGGNLLTLGVVTILGPEAGLTTVTTITTVGRLHRGLTQVEGELIDTANCT